MTYPPACSVPPELTAIPSPAVVVLVGAAGAGKSTLAHCWDRHAVASLDACRAQVSGDPADQDATPDAVWLLHRMVRNRSLAGLTTVVDATNLDPGHREPFVQMARACGLPAIAVVLTTPLEVCQARQRDRLGPLPGRKWGRRVPDEVVAAQHAAVIASIPALPTEGFSAVYVINPEGT